MALSLYGKFKPLQTSNNSSNRKKERKKENIVPWKLEFPNPPGSTHPPPKQKKELNYTLKLVTPGRTFLKMSRTQ